MTEIERQMVILDQALLHASTALRSLDALLHPLEPIREDVKTCEHPRKQSMATMTDQHAWYCPDCQTSGSLTL